MYSSIYGSVQIASEIQDVDLSLYRGIYLDILSSGREYIKPYNPNGEWGEVWTSVLGQRWKLMGEEGGMICGCAWGGGDDSGCARDRIFGDDVEFIYSRERWGGGS